MTKSYQIDGLQIEIIGVRPTTDVRFFSQRQLLAINNRPDALAELNRRATIINGAR